MDNTFKPKRSKGMILCLPFISTTSGRAPFNPIITGSEGPWISASMMPTRAFCLASESARFTVTVDLPTPPLPEATAMMFLTPGSRFRSPRIVVTRLVKLICTDMSVPKSSSSAARQSASSFSFIGHAGVVRTIVKLMEVPSIKMSSTIFRVTRSFRKSGSSTLLRASST